MKEHSILQFQDATKRKLRVEPAIAKIYNTKPDNPAAERYCIMTRELRKKLLTEIRREQITVKDCPVQGADHT